MAAYAALVSLMNLIDQIQNHPRPQITLHQKQVESLSEKIACLEDFLEDYNTYDGDEEVDRLRSRIADAAYAAEDVIESQVVDQITQSSNFRGDNIISLRMFFEEAAEDVIATHVVGQTLAQSSTHDGEKICSVDLYQGLQKVIQDMDSIKKDVMEIKDKVRSPDQLQRIITTSESPSTEKNTMVDFDSDFLNEVLDKLTGDHSGRQIISISGMGGIGKTTFARNVFKHPLIKYRFEDVLAWVTISQDYNIREILLEILLCLKNQGNKKSLNQKSEGDLGLQLHICLSGRRYLIIMDDVWSVEPLYELKSSFPDNNITTLISKLSRELHGTIGLEISFLNGDQSWDLFCKIVFGEQGCPDELEQIGKKNCEKLQRTSFVYCRD